MDKVNWLVWIMVSKLVVKRYKDKQMVLGFVEPFNNGKGVAIVKSTDQAGKFTLQLYSGLLKSDQVTVFTGKSDQSEKTV